MKPVLALVLGLILTFQSAESVNATQPLKLQLLTTSAQITPGTGGNAATNIEVIVSGGKKARLSLRVIDLILEKTGKSPVPAGSTDYTLEKQLKFEPAFFDYVPSGSPRKFTFRVSAINNDLKEVRFGGIQSVLTTTASKNKASSELAAITTFAIVPMGLSINLGNEALKSAEISGLRLFQKSKNSLADWIFPDIPGIVNQSPVNLEVKIANKNNLPVFTHQEVTWANENRILNTQKLSERLLFADQEIDLSSDSTKLLDNSLIQKNFAKPFETLKVKIVFSTFLGSQILKPVTKEVSVLVFPWKELLFWTLILALVVWKLVRVRRRIVLKRDPNIVWLFLVWVIKSITKKIKTSVFKM